MVQLGDVSVASDVASRGGDHTECGGEGVESTDAQEVEGKRRRGTERRKSRDVDGLLGSEELACRSGNGAGAEDEEVRIFRLAVFVRIFWVVWVRPAVFVRIFCVVGLGLVVCEVKFVAIKRAKKGRSVIPMHWYYRNAVSAPSKRFRLAVSVWNLWLLYARLALSVRIFGVVAAFVRIFWFLYVRLALCVRIFGLVGFQLADDCSFSGSCPARGLCVNFWCFGAEEAEDAEEAGVGAMSGPCGSLQWLWSRYSCDTSVENAEDADESVVVRSGRRLLCHLGAGGVLCPPAFPVILRGHAPLRCSSSKDT